MKLNNHGQTLVLFILLVPFLITLMAIVIELGLNSSVKRKTDKITKYVVEYGVENKTEENVKTKMEKLINSNLDNVREIKIDITENVKVEITVTFNNIFDGILKNNVATYTSKYKGYIENEKVKIVRG